MKRKRKIGCVGILGVAVVSMLLLSSCGSSGGSSGSTNSFGTEQTATAETTAAIAEDAGFSGGYAEDAKAEEGSGSAEEGQAEEVSQRKLIKTVSMDVETEQFDSLLGSLQTRVAGCGGYIESSITGSAYYERGNRYANFTIRIPSDQLDSFIHDVTELANVTWKNENVQDVTLQYVDVESHKLALQTEQERLLELMAQAATVEDLIRIEDRLADIRYQIQNYESTLRTLDNQIHYSTVTISISEVTKLTPQEKQNAWTRIKEGFSENCAAVIRGVQNFVIEVIIAIPYLVILAIITLIIIIFTKILRKKNTRGTTKQGNIEPKQDDAK